MQEKITFSQLCSMVSTRASVSRKVTEEYLRAFFSAIGDALARGESVKIKGLGTFKTTKIAERRSVNVSTGQEIVIPSHNRITFVPAPAMAQAVNSPFSAFEAVELADSFTDADLAALDNPQEPPAVTAPVEELSDEDNEADTPKPVETPVAPPVIEEQTEDEDVSFEEIIPSPAVVAAPPSPEPVLEDDSLATEVATPPALPHVDKEPPVTPPVDKEPPMALHVAAEATTESVSKPKMRFTFWGGFFSALGLVAVICGFILLCCPDIVQFSSCTALPEKKIEPVVAEATPSHQSTVQTPVDEEAEKQALIPATEPGQEAQTEDSTPAEPVYDTISKTRYLTTMAKEHYGNYHFWPYIYEENKAFLRHPDRIKPGTRVVIPPLSKYGVDPNNSDDLREAKRKGAAIYARYR